MRALRLTSTAVLAAAGLAAAAQQSVPRPPHAPTGRPDDVAQNEAVLRANTDVDAHNEAASQRYDLAMAAYAKARAESEAAAGRPGGAVVRPQLAAPAPAAVAPNAYSAAVPAALHEPVADEKLADAAPPGCPAGAQDGKAACYPSISATSVMPASLSAAINSRSVSSTSVALRPLSTRLDP